MPRAPVPTDTGEGGALYMPGMIGNETVAVFKPMAKEAKCELRPVAGIRKGTIAGEGYLREAAAYQVDHPIRGGRGEKRVDTIGFSGVPPTCIVEIYDPLKQYETEGIGSLQKFVPNTGSCEGLSKDEIDALPISDVHKIAVLDLRLANADRHQGNMLKVNHSDGTQLIPIDHGYCWPYTFEGCRFDWMGWPQAKEPFSQETREYISSLNAEEDIAILRHFGWDMPQEYRCIPYSNFGAPEASRKRIVPF